MRQGLYISVVVVLQLIAAFAIQLTIFRLVGIGPETDAYIAAQTVPSVLSAIIISALQSVWLPRMTVFSHDATAWRIEQAGAQGQVFIMGACAYFVIWLGAAWWQPILFPGLSAEQLHSAYLFAGPLFIAAAIDIQSALLTIALRSRNRFLVAEVVAMVGALVSLVLIVKVFPLWGLEAVPWIVAIRAIVVYLVHLNLADWPGINIKVGLTSRETWQSMRPLLLGASIYKTSPLLDRFWASQAPVGGMTALFMAQMAMGALSTVIERSVSMPVTPTLSHFVALRDYQGLRMAYRTVVKRITLLVLVFSALFVAMYPVFVPVTISLLKVTEDTAFDIWLLCLLLMGFTYVAASGGIVAAGFYALGDTSTPPKVGMATLPLGVLFKSFGFLTMGIEGLAIGITAIYFVMMLTMVVLFERKLHEFMSKTKEV